tara:strand:+ start:2502 stop:2846 length:345 start_codon:yes stop_codon:yes gene_type:complete
MLDRNEKRDILVNDHPLYRKMIKERGIEFIRHFSKMKISYIPPESMGNLTIVDHVYATGDSLMKLAHRYYGDVRYWWILAAFNKKPIDNLIKLGDIVHIPFPLEEAAYLLDKDG